MASEPKDNDLSSLERARESLYRPARSLFDRAKLSQEHPRDLPHEWEESKVVPKMAKRKPVHLAAMFLGVSVVFFLGALGFAGYLLYFGGNSVSTDKIDLAIQGPTTIAGGDTVPLSLTITNRNPVALKNATIEIDFPDGTRSATDVLSAYPRYVENLGTIQSGATITRSIKAVIFGAAGQTIALPVSLSYGAANSNATFQKKSSYALAISSTPLSVSVETLAETVSGKPLTFALTVRSNATVTLSNVVLQTTFPFGFSVASSSLPLQGSEMAIGSLAPGQSKQVLLTGTLVGQDNEQRVFHFTVGTAVSAQDPTLAVTYMTQDANVTIAAPFISTDLSFNGNTSDTIVLSPGITQNVKLAYANTLPTTVTNATIRIALSGNAIDYNSISVSNGFYDSASHTIVFSQDTDGALASLAPEANGAEAFSFATLPASATSQSADFSISVSGTRVGQANVPEQVSASTNKTAKVLTTVNLAGSASHFFNTQALAGPVPPTANQPTTYAVSWTLTNTSSAVAGATVTATLPDYVAYVGTTGGTGTFSYDNQTRILTWSVGDLSRAASAQGTFEVVLTPSTSQRGGAVPLVNGATFNGYDRFSQVNISAALPAITTQMITDPGFVSADGTVR